MYLKINISVEIFIRLFSSSFFLFFFPLFLKLDVDNIPRIRKKIRMHRANMTEQKIFSGQVNCTCKKKCAEKIDVYEQKEIFTKYWNLRNWSSKVQFLRALVKTSAVRENLNPIIQVKKRQQISKYYIFDSSGKHQNVCLHFIARFLQVNQTKMFRALSQTTDHRGKYPHKRRISDSSFLKSFIKKLPTFEARFNSPSTGTKFLHPCINFKKMYSLYDDQCKLFKKKKLSKSFFAKIFHENFNFVFLRKKKSDTIAKILINASNHLFQRMNLRS